MRKSFGNRQEVDSFHCRFLNGIQLTFRSTGGGACFGRLQERKSNKQKYSENFPEKLKIFGKQQIAIRINQGTTIPADITGIIILTIEERKKLLNNNE